MGRQAGAGALVRVDAPLRRVGAHVTPGRRVWIDGESVDNFTPRVDLGGGVYLTVRVTPQAIDTITRWHSAGT
jgi:hypothetical protein